MIIQLLGAISLAEYVEAESAEGTEGVRKPENCARCGARDCFWKHGRYQRTVIEGSQEQKISVTRLICKSCGLTVSLLQSFMVPYRQFSAAAISQAVEVYVDGTAGSYLEAADSVSSTEEDVQKPSSSQVFRWTDLLAWRAERLLAESQKEIMLRGREGDLPENGTNSPNAVKAMTTLKRKRVNLLAELLSLGAVLVGEGDNLLCRLHHFFLFNAESMKALWSGRKQRLPAPHNMQCVIF